MKIIRSEDVFQGEVVREFWEISERFTLLVDRGKDWCDFYINDRCSIDGFIDITKEIGLKFNLFADSEVGFLPMKTKCGISVKSDKYEHFLKMLDANSWED